MYATRDKRKTIVAGAAPAALTADGYPAFAPRFPWVNGDLQTLRNALHRRAGRLPPDPGGERLLLPLHDGSGDALAARLTQGRPESGRPLVVVIHGMTGSEGSSYMAASARYFAGRGHPVVRLNLRGCGPSRRTARQQGHLDRTGDLADALGGLPPGLMDDGVFLVGISGGGSLLARFLAELGSRFPILGAALVSAPLDAFATTCHFLQDRNRVYHRWLLRRLKAQALAGDLTAAERETVRRARTVWQLDDRFFAPQAGYRNALEYYVACDVGTALAKTPVPVLAVHATDDPWVPAEPFRVLAAAGHDRVTTLLAEGGGHVGFHGTDALVPWHDRCIAQFMDGLSAAA